MGLFGIGVGPRGGAEVFSSGSKPLIAATSRGGRGKDAPTVLHSLGSNGAWGALLSEPTRKSGVICEDWYCGRSIVIPVPLIADVEGAIPNFTLVSTVPNCDFDPTGIP